jgi:CMP-N-acetylneuraminic acid synthetase
VRLHSTRSRPARVASRSINLYKCRFVDLVAETQPAMSIVSTNPVLTLLRLEESFDNYAQSGTDTQVIAVTAATNSYMPQFFAQDDLTSVPMQPRSVVGMRRTTRLTVGQALVSWRR